MNRRDGVVVRASASQSIDLGFHFFCRVHIKRLLQIASIASLLGARHLKDVVKINQQVRLVVSLGKVLNGTPLLLCG